MSGRNGLIAIVLAVACMAGLAGCPRGAEFSQANYQTVFTGQQQHEVQSKLGRPQTETPEYWQYISLDPYYRAARIYFHNGVVTHKEWFASAAELTANKPTTRVAASHPTSKPARIK